MTDDEAALLPELLLQSELICSSLEARIQDMPPGRDLDELRFKISQCRGTLSELQSLFDNGQLLLSHRPTAANFRQLVMSLMWVLFYARTSVDFRLFRKLVAIESTLTFLLINEIPFAGPSQKPRP
jgi:hypothetical protein